MAIGERYSGLYDLRLAQLDWVSCCLTQFPHLRRQLRNIKEWDYGFVSRAN
jgi:hypothetical protein